MRADRGPGSRQGGREPTGDQGADRRPGSWHDLLSAPCLLAPCPPVGSLPSCRLPALLSAPCPPVGSLPSCRLPALLSAPCPPVGSLASCQLPALLSAPWPPRLPGLLSAPWPPVSSLASCQLPGLLRLLSLFLLEPCPLRAHGS